MAGSTIMVMTDDDTDQVDPPSAKVVTALLREARSVSRRADKLGADVAAVQEPTIQQLAAQASGSIEQLVHHLMLLDQQAQRTRRAAGHANWVAGRGRRGDPPVLDPSFGRRSRYRRTGCRKPSFSTPVSNDDPASADANSHAADSRLKMNPPSPASSSAAATTAGGFRSSGRMRRPDSRHPQTGRRSKFARPNTASPNADVTLPGDSTDLAACRCGCCTPQILTAVEWWVGWSRRQLPVRPSPLSLPSLSGRRPGRSHTRSHSTRAECRTCVLLSGLWLPSVRRSPGVA